MSELNWKPAHELAAMIRNREIKASELMELTIRRIEQTNPKINAFCALRADDAIRDARALDEKIARREDLGPLAGLPFGVKDLEDAAGLTTTFGSKPFRNNRPTHDSVQVARLKAAGAIVIGKTNAPEFGYTAHTKNLLFGVTRNPWNLERTPGGSSGGSSAAIAGGVVPLATGSDGGGSVRNPGVLRRMLRAEAVEGTHPARRDARDAWMERHRGRRPADPHGARRRDVYGRGGRVPSRGPRLSPASRNLLPCDARAAPEKIAHRVSS